jgi:hypothetical protein
MTFEAKRVLIAGPLDGLAIGKRHCEHVLENLGVVEHSARDLEKCLVHLQLLLVASISGSSQSRTRTMTSWQ